MQGWDFQNVWIPPNQAGQAGQATAHYPEFYLNNHVLVLEANASRTYGDANPAFLASVSGLRSYDTPSIVSTSVSTTATQTSNVGNYAMSVGLTRSAVSSGRRNLSRPQPAGHAECHASAL